MLQNLEDTFESLRKTLVINTKMNNFLVSKVNGYCHLIIVETTIIESKWQRPFTLDYHCHLQSLIIIAICSCYRFFLNIEYFTLLLWTLDFYRKKIS